MKFIPLKTKIKYLNKIYLFQGCLCLVAAVDKDMDDLRYVITCWNPSEDCWNLLGYSRTNYFECIEEKGVIFHDNTQENLIKLKLIL